MYDAFMKKESLPVGDRLERYIAHQGIASRREAKDLIAGGLVMVNGKVVKDAGFRVDPTTDKIVLDTKKIPSKETVLLYKPRGIETSKTSPKSQDIHDVFPRLGHLSPIGRLDKDSEGLILLSNDGTLARALTAESHIEKEYVVTVREAVQDIHMKKMSQGIVIDDVITKPAKARKMSDHSFSIILKEGRKHQIRRMCEACRLTVESLVRVRIGTLTSKGMKSGSVKTVSSKEVEKLKKQQS